MKAGILAVLAVAAAACGPSTVDMARTTELFRKVEDQRRSLARTGDDCGFRRKMARTTPEFATVVRQEDARRLDDELQRIHESIPACRELDAGLEQLVRAESDLKLWCDSHLEACELHRRREAVVK